MKVQAITRYVRVSPAKVIPLARLLRGLPVGKALQLVQFNTTKGGSLIQRTLKSAVANVENNAKRSADEFHVVNVQVERGPVMKRFWPRARGMVSPILRRTSHIRVTLSDD